MLITFLKVNYNSCFYIKASEAVARMCSVKKVLLEISQNSQENTCARVSFIRKETLFSCEFCEVSKNTFFYIKLLVAASDSHHVLFLFEVTGKTKKQKRSKLVIKKATKK